MNRTQHADHGLALYPGRPVGLGEFGLKFCDRDTDFTNPLVLSALEEAFRNQPYTVAAVAMATRFPNTGLLTIGCATETLTGLDRTNLQLGATLSPVEVAPCHAFGSKVVMRAGAIQATDLPTSVVEE